MDHDLSTLQVWLAILLTAFAIVVMTIATMVGLNVALGELGRLTNRIYS